MSARLHRVVLYVVGLETETRDPKEVVRILENADYIYPKVRDIQTVDVGEWSDEHPVNQTGTDLEQYFPDIVAIGEDDPWLKQEYRRVKGIMMNQIDKNAKLTEKVYQLERQLEGLKKLQELVIEFVHTAKHM